ncbi:MAG: ribosome maturation factor RimM [Candidatus Magnetoovum sp. WYHC-5]|nr:ribosome maturation factor RimM [Candidatus Magnetoovum sp. WYHC-5]
MNLITIGTVLKGWGIKGELKVRPLNVPVEFFRAIKTVYIENTDKIIEKRDISNVKFVSKYVVIKIIGIDLPEKADMLQGAFLKADNSDFAPLPEGHYYYHQIIGLKVLTEDGQEKGVIKDILPVSSNDVYVAEDRDVNGIVKEYLIPAIADIVKEINVGGGFIIIYPMGGLFE